jgi:outer membrane protein TolC
MNKTGKYRTLRLISIFIVLTFNFVHQISIYGQQKNSTAGSQLQADSLLLSQIINDVIQNHPSVKQAAEALNIADAKIGLAKAGYYPYVDLSGSYTRIDPVPTITLEPFGKFVMAPNNNYNASLNYNQNIYDFGRTSKDVAYQNESKNLTQQSIEQLKQEMAFMVTNIFYTLLYLQDAIDIKKEQLQTLKEHLDFIIKKKETGSATEYEILTTQVKISGVESQKIDLETARISMVSAMNTLLGRPEMNPINVKKELEIELPAQVSDSLISYAENNRNEMRIAQENTKLANLTYQLAKSQHNPILGLYASGGWKNGYFPNLNVMEANYAVGIGLQVPLFNATKTKNNVLLSKSLIQTADYATEVVRRNIANEVVQSKANVSASQEKINQFKLQLSQAQKALTLAEISYKSGVITNLDLLDATTAVSESRLSLLKAQIDYVVSIYKLKVALGEKLY